jgi:Ca-activated chloride channel family protein
MKLEPNDPRLTAYALGELAPREAAILEAELAESPEGQRALVEIRHTAELLRQALAAEPAPALSSDERARIIAATGAAGAEALERAGSGPHAPARARPVSPAARRTGWLRRNAAAVAVCSVIVLVTAALLMPATQMAREAAGRRSIAMNDASGAPGASAQPWQQDDTGYVPPADNSIALDKQALSGARMRPFGFGQDPTGGEGEKPVAVPAQLSSSASERAAQGPPWGVANEKDAKVWHQRSDQVQLAPASPTDEFPVAEPLAGNLRRGDVSGGQVGGDLQGPTEQLSDVQVGVQTQPYFALRGGANGQQGQGFYAVEEKMSRGVVTSAGKQRSNGVVHELYNHSAPASGAPAIDDPSAADWAGKLAPRMNFAVLPERQAGGGLQQMVTPRVIVQGEEEELVREGGRFAVGGARGFNTEAYDPIVENAFQSVAQQPLSTFSIDVDTASYANVRRFLSQGTLPPPGAVRIEEMINYFRYDYAPPQAAGAKDDHPAPFAAHTVVAACPWTPGHRLVRIALKGREIAVEDRPASNLVFLLDVSGSMRDGNKLPLVKEGLRLLVEKLGENDRVAIVVYAGASGLVLPSTLGTHKEKIMYAIDQLEAGGSTNGASGIQLAYDTAVANFIKGGANRVILATDGDFNVGITDQSQLVELIEQKAASGVFLSVLGFGMGNLKDANLEKLADKGNGNYAYIDALPEARKVLVEELSGTLVTIAKDVKIQVEFNPARVQSHRLIGYENRILAKEDFNNDKKDAGEIGAGHTVTALYEVVPAGATGAVAPEQPSDVDKLEYQTETQPNEAAARSSDLLTLKLRYKEPEGSESRLLKFPVPDRDQQIGAAGNDFEFAAAVAAFGMLLRNSAHQGAANYSVVLELAQGGLGADKEGYRREFIELVKRAQRLHAKR